MIDLQFLALILGTSLIRVIHAARRRLVGEERYFSFSDFLIEERHIRSRGFIYMALPPYIGGLVMALIPGVQPITVAAAGFLAAFLGVWPVFQFPCYLLDEYLLPYWGKLKFLYILFVGFSTSLAYLGSFTTTKALPIVISLTGTQAWQKFLDDVAANAFYDVMKAIVITLFVAGGIYVSRERKQIGVAIKMQKEREWKDEMAVYSQRNHHEDFETTADVTSNGKNRD